MWVLYIIMILFIKKKREKAEYLKFMIIIKLSDILLADSFCSSWKNTVI